MNNDRIVDLGEDLRNHVFEVLDNEPELTGEDAGFVARKVEEAFTKALQERMAWPSIDVDVVLFSDIKIGEKFATVASKKVEVWRKTLCTDMAHNSVNLFSGLPVCFESDTEVAKVSE